MDKRIIVPFFLVVAIILLSAYYYYLHPQVEALELLDEILKKIEEVDELGISYSAVLTYYSDSTETVTEGTVDFIYANKSSKSLFKFKTFSGFYPASGRVYEVSYYSLPEGNVVCIKTSIITSEYSCEEIEPLLVIEEYPLDYSTQIKLLKEWLEKDMVSVSYLGEREFLNRKCDYFKFDVDFNKLLSELETKISRDLYPTPIPLRKTQANYTIFSCFDKELGFGLYYSYKIRVNHSYDSYSYSSGIEGKYEAKSLTFDVDENQIRLPVPRDEVVWLPRFDIIETLCKPNSNEVKLAIEAKKDVPAGTAVLNVSGYETVTSYPYAEVDGYNHYCFSVHDLKSGSTIRFTFRAKNDTSSRQFVIGIDCSEAHGKLLYPYSYYGCEDCSGGGKYCSMGTWTYPSYTFYSDYSGAHEICVWPTSERGYTWQLDRVEIEKKVLLQGETDFEGMKKGDVKILSFTIPSTLREDKYYYLYLEIEGLKASSYCYTSEIRPPFTGFLTKLVEKIMNITT